MDHCDDDYKVIFGWKIDYNVAMDFLYTNGICLCEDEDGFQLDCENECWLKSNDIIPECVRFYPVNDTLKNELCFYIDLLPKGFSSNAKPLGELTKISPENIEKAKEFARQVVSKKEVDEPRVISAYDDDRY